MGLKTSVFSLLRYWILRVIIKPINLFLDELQGYFDGPTTPNRYLQGNFAPVHKELTAINLPISHGALPSDIAGEFVRNGPNSSTRIPKGGHHWFDGDGMLHGLRISKDGKASYINRLTKTKIYVDETENDMPIRTRIGEMHGKIGLLKILWNNLQKLLGLIPVHNGTANTALVFHNKKLQALVESDIPYEIQVLNDGQFETAGRMAYGGKITAMTAHPKVDPVTNELFFFWYDVLFTPHVTYGYADPKGNVVSTMPIDLPTPIMMHDFAVSERHAIFLDLNLVFNKKRIIFGNIFGYDHDHKARVGILDRYAKNADGIKWFPVPPNVVFHTANAWDDGDEVVLCTCKSIAERFDLDDTVGSKFGLVEWRFNMKTGEFKEIYIVKEFFTEFPQINPAYQGRKNTYVYTVTSLPINGEAPSYAEFTGLLKINIETKEIVKVFTYGANKFGGEAVFVPKQNAKSEDDGYLLTFVYNKANNSSSFWVIDSKTMSDIVAIVELPQRVPYGFHGIFISEADIQSQC